MIYKIESLIIIYEFVLHCSGPDKQQNFNQTDTTKTKQCINAYINSLVPECKLKHCLFLSHIPPTYIITSSLNPVQDQMQLITQKNPKFLHEPTSESIIRPRLLSPPINPSSYISTAERLYKLKACVGAYYNAS